MAVLFDNPLPYYEAMERLRNDRPRPAIRPKRQQGHETHARGSGAALFVLGFAVGLSMCAIL